MANDSPPRFSEYQEIDFSKLMRNLTDFEKETKEALVEANASILALKTQLETMTASITKNTADLTADGLAISAIQAKLK